MMIKKEAFKHMKIVLGAMLYLAIVFRYEIIQRVMWKIRIYLTLKIQKCKPIFNILEGGLIYLLIYQYIFYGKK